MSPGNAVASLGNPLASRDNAFMSLTHAIAKDGRASGRFAASSTKTARMIRAPVRPTVAEVKGGAMSKYVRNDRAQAVLEQYGQAMTGLETAWPAGQPPMVLQQVPYTPAALVVKLQQECAPLQAVVDARSDLATALTNRHTALPGAVSFLDAFFAVLPQYLPPGADVTQFGGTPKKERAPLTAEQKVAANEKRNATRAARHIMGKNQRKALHAAAPTPPAAPSTPAK
jgi:hypothetical protein